MKKRHKIPNGPSKQLFTNTAKFVHPKNAMPTSIPMRGGIRL